jgi:hypothetical protein
MFVPARPRSPQGSRLRGQPEEADQETGEQKETAATHEPKTSLGKQNCTFDHTTETVGALAASPARNSLAERLPPVTATAVWPEFARPMAPNLPQSKPLTKESPNGSRTTRPGPENWRESMAESKSLADIVPVSDPMSQSLPHQQRSSHARSNSKTPAVGLPKQSGASLRCPVDGSTLARTETRS